MIQQLLIPNKEDEIFQLSISCLKGFKENAIAITYSHLKAWIINAHIRKLSKKAQNITLLKGHEFCRLERISILF